MTGDSPKGRSNHIERLIFAPPEAVFAAWSNVETLVRWMAPAGMTIEISDFDFRPGGGMSLYLHFGQADPMAKTGADHDRVQSRFVEIDAPHLVVVDTLFISDKLEFGGAMRATWKIDAVGPHSLVQVVTENVPVGIALEDHKAGVSAILANMARILEQDPES